MNHPIFICQNIAEKLRDPKNVQSIAEASLNQIRGPSSYWQSYSFADGFAGIAYFFSAMDQAFPGERWNVVAEQYLLEALKCFKEHKAVNYSLFKGLAGISFAMSSNINGSSKFQEFHAGIDEWLIEEVTQTYLMSTPRLLEEDFLIPPFIYTFPSGLSGILSYLLKRKDHPYLQIIAQRCAEELAKIMLAKKRVGSLEVNAWYFTQNELTEVYREPNAEGGYNTSMLYGVTGCLIALASAINEGLCSDNIYKATERISFWLKDVYQSYLRIAFGIGTYLLME